MSQLVCVQGQLREREEPVFAGVGVPPRGGVRMAGRSRMS